ncbi:MAG: methyltransferase domain-containing protein [Actinobacteria bacterium]|nr:methyltransferase domain-containing protein [Actinomycetota bacterium]
MRVACTIVARNYLAQARVLAGSFLRHHPDHAFCVLVLDAGDAGAPSEPFPVVRPQDVLERGEFERLATMYTVVELATAVKPSLLRSLFTDGVTSVVYFDPDIEVFRNLDEAFEAAERSGTAFTPHNVEPPPRDGDLTPAEDVVLSVGTFNLGFVAVGVGGLPFLDWWAARLRRDCIILPERQRFVDQRWCDLALGYFGGEVLRSPALNVAWWNVATRRIEEGEGGYRVAGEPLGFVHFSGFDPDLPHLLSTHQGPAPRVLLSERPDLAALWASYGAKLGASGHAQLRVVPYGLGWTRDGIPIDARMRAIYRDALLASERDGSAEPPNAFRDGAEGSFVEWLRRVPPGRGARVPRYLLDIRDTDGGIRTRFPHIPGHDEQRYLDWINDGACPHDIPIAFHPATRMPEPPVSGTNREPKPGINLVGYLRAESGVGEAGRRMLAAIRAAGIPHSTVVYDRTLSRQRHPFADSGSGEPGAFDVNVICVNADQILAFNHDIGPDLRDRWRRIGVWWWEVEAFPPTQWGAFDVVDEVWTGSAFAARAIAATTEKPVRVVPVVVAPAPPTGMTRHELGLPDGFLFLFSFDFDSVFERKNPLGVIHAFLRAFPSPGTPQLVVKSINGDRHRVALELLRHAALGRPDIHIVDGYVSATAQQGMMERCDCYVSLHRSEGFGLTLAEAMSVGTPVIATGYSGNLDFMTSETSYLVPYTLQPIPLNCPPYPAGSSWADPDLAAAAAAMRLVVSDPTAARDRGARGRAAILERYSADAAASFIVARLDELRASDDVAEPEPEPGQTWADVSAAASDRVDRGALLPEPMPDGGVRQFARRLLFRGLRPYLRARSAHDRATADALRALQRQIDGIVGATRPENPGRLGPIDVEVQRLKGRLDDQEGRETGRSKDVVALQRSVWELVSQLRARPYVSAPGAIRTTDEHGMEVMGFATDRLRRDDAYVGFEDLFRGPEAFIQDRQRIYVGMVRGHEPIVDIGCGRGEFLDALGRDGQAGIGIDTDPGMVARAREKGLDVHEADAFAWLGSRQDGSIGVIFSAQVIEHMPGPDVGRFFALCHRKLKPGGLLIAETVNPHSIPALKTFWVDLTHRVPIFPEVALALCGIQGFAEARIVFPVCTGSLESCLDRSGEYAVVARRGTQ